MSLLNLSVVEFLAIFVPIAATVVALYLYDRARRRQIVSTLRFFERARSAPVFTRRKKIQQPWSLILQLASIALLLLAIAELGFGPGGQRGRDHVLIVDTSAWMNSAAPGTGSGNRATLMQLARRRALDYLKAVPGEDRVMLIRADQLATPATPFTRNRTELEAAIRGSEAGVTALNLPAALELARSLQARTTAAARGEVAVVTSGRVMPADLDRAALQDASNLRSIVVGGEPNDCGIRKLSARRSPADPLLWEVEIGAFNYGAAARRQTLGLTFGGNRVGSRTLAMAPRTASEASFQFRSAHAGMLEATLDSRDDYRNDNRAAIELPAMAPLKVQVYTSKPELWQPLLTASSYLQAEFRAPGAYSPDGPPRRLVILDGFRPPVAPNADAVWIAAGGARAGGPFHVRRWDTTHPIAAGLHNKDVRVTSATILQPGEQEVVVAECDGGPVVTASTGAGPKKVTFGFHPLEEGLQNHLAIPLLFANLVRWVSPELFRSTEISARPPGLVELETPPGTRGEQVQVRSPEIRALASTLVGNRLRLFTQQAGTVHITMPDREVVYMLNLPEVGEARWTPPAGARHGVPPSVPGRPLRRDLWPWLAVAGALGLLLEWILYGRQPATAALAGRRRSPGLSITPATPEPEAQEVHS